MQKDVYPRFGEVFIKDLFVRFTVHSPSGLTAAVFPQAQSNLEKGYYLRTSVTVIDGGVSYNIPFNNQVDFEKLKAVSEFLTNCSNLGDEFFLNLLTLKD